MLTKVASTWGIMGNFCRVLFASSPHMALKTLAVLDDAELRDGEMKQVSFENGEVLLSRLGDKVHATSAFCTHYGAPLAKGVLTFDGRVVCPWHGACFNVCTGDIEDAPATGALHSFRAHVADGKIYVTADPARSLKDNMSRAPRPVDTSNESSGKGVVIVGGGSGAFYATQSMREHGYKGPITILTKENHVPIDRTKLSKTLSTDPAKIEWISPADLKIKYSTTIRTGVAVTSVDIESRRVTLGGNETVAYDQLILAPGGIPRRLPVECAMLENVFTFRGVEDAKKVNLAAQEGKRMVVIGSSFIGMEIVSAVASRKLASIDVIGTGEYPFEMILGKEVGKGLKQFFEGTHGVKFHMQSKVEKIVSSEENPSEAGGVIVNGQTIPADLVIMAVGVTPASDFLKNSGIELERDGGVKVDEFLRVEGVNNVYAIGDIAHFPDATTGLHVRIEHWNVAGNHGRAVGKTIAGIPQKYDKIPVFWSIQGLRYCGYGVGFDDVIIKGNPADMKFIAYYVKQGRIIAVASMQNDPVVAKATQLLRLSIMPSPEAIRAGKDLLTIDVSSMNAGGADGE